MNQKISEKKLLLAWGAFFGLMYIPLTIAIGVWTELIEDENITDVLAILFLAATSYFSFRLIVTKMIFNKTNVKEVDSCSVQTAETK
jgi:hypothetical protein